MAKMIRRGFKITNKDCAFIAKVLLVEPLEKPEDIIIGKLYYTDNTEIELEDPAYGSLKEYAHRILEKRRQIGQISFDP